MVSVHQIKRLQVDLQVTDQEQARALQQEVSTFCRTQLPDVLQDVFDSAAADRYLRIERLEITLPPFKDVADFRSKVAERLRNELGFQLAAVQDVGAAAALAAAGSGKTPEHETATFDIPYQAADVFLHILKYGTPPWHAVAMDFDDIVSEVTLLLEAEHSFRFHLAAVFSTYDQVLRRFLLQTPAPARRRILALLSGNDESLIEALEAFMETFMEALARRASLVAHYRLPVREIICRHILQKGSLDNGLFRLVLEKVIAKLATASGINVHGILSDLSLADIETETVLPMHWRTAFDNTLGSFRLSGNRYIDNSDLALPADKTVLPPEKGEPEDSAEEKRTADGSTAQEAAADAVDTSSIAAESAEQEMLTGSERATVEKREQPGSIQPEEDWSEPDDGALDRAEPPEKSIPRQEDKNFPLEDDKRRDISRGMREAEKVRDYSEDSAGKGPPKKQGGHAGEQDRDLAGHIGQPAREEHQHGASSDHGFAPGDSSFNRSEPAEGLPWMSSYETEEFHVTNAGLVLLAPFFGQVFKNLGYLNKERDFISEDMRVRAIHFSQFLVTDKQHPPESTLVLNKILCGMEVNESLERYIDVTAAERGAAQEVIDSALEHWTALKRTSAPVFRQTFLRHEGILTYQGTSRLLRIERTSVDVLLDTLPWTISIIKHPWMQQPVIVEW